jgi:hypothetical protein
MSAIGVVVFASYDPRDPCKIGICENELYSPQADRATRERGFESAVDRAVEYKGVSDADAWRQKKAAAEQDARERGFESVADPVPAQGNVR